MIYLNDTLIEEKSFPDGTPLIKFDWDWFYTKSQLGFDNNSITWKYDNDGELFRLVCLRKHLRNVPMDLYLPYVPNARQDRVRGQDDVFTLKYFAEEINSLGFKRVFCMDAHSDVAPALIDNFHAMSPVKYIEKAINGCSDTPILFYPDTGSAKRYSDMLILPYACGIKHRAKTGDIESLTVSDNGIDLQGKTILIVDDICSRGGTFLRSAKKLKELGVDKIYLYITHCENTILEGDLLTSGLIERVFTTDSIFRKSHEKIEVFQI